MKVGAAVGKERDSDGVISVIGDLRRVECVICRSGGLRRRRRVRRMAGSRVGYTRGKIELFDCVIRACGGKQIVGHGPKRGDVSTKL